MKIRLKKIKELPYALNPNNIAEGFIKEGEIPDHHYKPPTMGERFHVTLSWSTSGVLEIIDDKTFRTYSSIYEWEAIKS